MARSCECVAFRRYPVWKHHFFLVFGGGGRVPSKSHALVLLAPPPPPPEEKNSELPLFFVASKGKPKEKPKPLF